MTSILRPRGMVIDWPGRYTTEIVENRLTNPSALPSHLTAAAGTMTYGTFTGASSNGWAKNTSGAVSGNAAAIKGASPLNAITPNNLMALALTLEGLNTDADTGMDIEIGFQGLSNKGGATFMHLNGAAHGIIRTKDASSVATDTAANHAFFQASGGGRSRRNLTFILFPRGPRLNGSAAVYLLEDDSVIDVIDISSVFVGSQDVVPIWQIVTREAAAHNIQWRQSKILLNNS